MPVFLLFSVNMKTLEICYRVSLQQVGFKLTKIMFVCPENICRSPMAEFIFKKFVLERGGQFEVVSSATSRKEVGNPVCIFSC